MSLSLWPALLRWPVKAQDDEGLENILDIKKENAFLRLAVLVLGAVLVVACLHMLLHPNYKEVVYLSPPCVNPVYADAPRTATGEEEKQDTKPPEPDAEGLAAVKALLIQKIRPKRRETKRSGSGSTAPVSIPSGGAVGIGGLTSISDNNGQSDLWSLLDQIRNDPTRDLIEKSVETAGVTITFHEITVDGKLHFELVNGGNGTVYLPNIEGSGARKVFIERRVLDPGVSAQGVVLFKERRRTFDLTFKAANIAAYQFQLEVPQ